MPFHCALVKVGVVNQQEAYIINDFQPYGMAIGARTVYSSESQGDVRPILYCAGTFTLLSDPLGAKQAYPMFTGLRISMY